MTDGYEAIELQRATLVSREVLSLHGGTDVLAAAERICPCEFGMADAYRGDDVVCVMAHPAGTYTGVRDDRYRPLRAYVFRSGGYAGHFEVKSCYDVPGIDRHPAIAAAFRAARGRKQVMERLYAGFGPGEELCVTGFMLNRMNGRSEHLFLLTKKSHQPLPR